MQDDQFMSSSHDITLGASKRWWALAYRHANHHVIEYEINTRLYRSKQRRIIDIAIWKRTSSFKVTSMRHLHSVYYESRLHCVLT